MAKAIFVLESSWSAASTLARWYLGTNPTIEALCYQLASF